VNAFALFKYCFTWPYVPGRSRISGSDIQTVNFQWLHPVKCDDRRHLPEMLRGRSSISRLGRILSSHGEELEPAFLPGHGPKHSLVLPLLLSCCITPSLHSIAFHVLITSSNSSNSSTPTYTPYIYVCCPGHFLEYLRHPRSSAMEATEGPVPEVPPPATPSKMQYKPMGGFLRG
jgi:hypothetical protein